MDLLPCRVKGVFVAVTPAGTAPTVILEAGDDTCLPIYIGLWEAISINTALQSEVSPRPLTHDLFPELFGRFSVSLKALHIDSIEGGVFYANLVLCRNNHEDIIDCRPSDGIAIALRCNSPIFLERAVIEESGLKPEQMPAFIDLQSFLQG